MMVRNNKYVLAALFGFALTAVFSMTSCVKEQLCEGTDEDPTLGHVHLAKANFKYDWSNIKGYGMSVPDSMFILVDRVVFQHMGSLGYDTKNETNEILSPLTSRQNKGMTDIKDVILYAGEYKFLTVNYSSTNFDYTEMQGMMDQNLSTRLGNTSIAYNVYSKGQTREDELILDEPENWSDANQYSRPNGSPAGFVLTETAPVVIDSTTIYKWNEGDSITVTFKPTTITQNVDIFFDIKKDIHNISFEIDSIYAVISGIPHRVNLGTGGLDISNTDKMIFRTNFVSPSQVPDENSVAIKDTPSNTTLRCYKNVTVLGIVENEEAEADLYAGPGVMQLLIYCKVYDQDGNASYKAVSGLVNIHKSLQNAKLQMYDPDLQLYHKTREHSDLYIAIDVTITKEMLVGSEDGGIEKWNEVTIPEEFDIY